MVRRTFWLFSLLLIVGCSSLQRAQTTIDLSVEHVAGAPVFVESANGSIEVRVEPGLDHVAVSGTLTATGRTRAEAEERLDDSEVVAVRRDDGTLDVHAHFPDGARGSDGCSFVVRLPGVRDVTVRSSNGSITVDGAAGAANLVTSNGSVTLLGQGGDAVVATSNGSIKLADVGGTVSARTSNGRIELSTVRDFVAPVDLRTSNGTVTVRLLGTPQMRIGATTSNGSVEVVGGGGVCQVSGSRTQKSIVLGDGGPASTIQTSNGSIRIVVTDVSG